MTVQLDARPPAAPRSDPAVVPPALQGVWRRTSVSVGDGPTHEPARVIWLQAATGFADLRLASRTVWSGREPAAEEPGSEGVGPGATAGTVRWAEPYLYRTPALDLGSSSSGPVAPSGHRVRGRVTRTGDEVVEERMQWVAGRPVPCVEVWHRLAGPDRPVVVLVSEDGTGRMVRIGDHAVTVVDDRSGVGSGAAYRVRGRRRGRPVWRTVLVSRPGAGALPTPPLADTVDAGAEVPGPGGRCWRVEEAHGVRL